MRALLAAVVAIGVACGGAAAPAAQLRPANPEAITTLAAGRVESLPTGPVYVRFIGFIQPPSYVINSKQHVPSVVYVDSGVHRLILNGEPGLVLTAGQATFHQSVTHIHMNPGAEPSSWYSIAIWPSSARGQPLVDPIARAAFESQDIDPTGLPQVPYSEVLRSVTLGGAESSGAHRFGGIAAFYVLSGALTIRSTRGNQTALAAGQGAAFAPDTAIDEASARSGGATYLEFVVTPVGKDFEVPLSRLS